MDHIKDQDDVSLQRGLPVEVVADSQHVVDVSESSVQFKYYNSGTLTTDAGQAAGTKVVAKLVQGCVLNSIGDVIGTKNDTSLAFTSTAFTTEVYVDPKIFEKWDTAAGSTKLTGILSDAGVTANGRYVVDYRTGTLFGIKASNQTTLTSATYKVAMQTSGGSSVAGSSINIAQLGGRALIADDGAFTPGTDYVIPIGMIADETATDSVNEGDVGIPRMTLDRRAIAASNYVDDTAFTPAGSASYVTMIGAEADETGPDSVDEGDAGALRMTLTRFLKVSQGDLISGEDQTNNLLQVVEKPLAVSTYAPDMDTSAAAEASSVTKASAGVLYGFTATNSSGSARYLQFFNSTTVPADATVPVLSYLIASGGSWHEVFSKGRYFSTGIAWCWSSTPATKTVGSTDGIVDVRYK